MTLATRSFWLVECPARQGSVDMEAKLKRRMEIDVEKYSKSWGLICTECPSHFQDTYRRGKTRMRDLLYDALGYSLLEAEEILDELERTGKIVFTRLRKGSRWGTWKIRKRRNGTRRPYR